MTKEELLAKNIKLSTIIYAQNEAIELFKKKLGYIGNANPYPDLSYHKYIDAFRFIDRQIEETLIEVNNILRKDKNNG